MWMTGTAEGPRRSPFRRGKNGTYTYAIYDYGKTGLLPKSGAVVRVYVGANETTFPVPTTGAGKWWHVFDLDERTGITPVNTLSDTKASELTPSGLKKNDSRCESASKERRLIQNG